jgi:HprK-related kinase A
MDRGYGVHRWWHSQANFRTDGQTPFSPFPEDHAFALFEWGLNWCIALQAHQYFMLHAAVLERNGKAILLPALPGSGKSTLCAALMLRGWRLLSDEFGLYRPETGLMEPLPRPIPLKNESIQVIRDFAPEAVLGPVFAKTRKGDVAHLRATDESMQRFHEPAKPAWVVFPHYHPDAEELLHPFAKGRAFLKLSSNSFNYRLQGKRGFNSAADIVENCDIHYLEFSDLNRAIDLLEEMAG